MMRWLAWATILAVLAVAGWYGLPHLLRRVEPPIVVGLLHSKAGPLSGVEGPVLDAEVLALEEINAAGGLLGRPLAWAVGDGRSDPQEFGREARRLIDSEKAAVLFGGMTSACRRSIEEAAASAKVLVFNSGAYEGMEVAKEMIGIGPLPNQQAVPAVSWCFDSLKARRFFLAGVPDVSSYAVDAVVRDQVKALGGSVAGEAYVGLDGSGMGELVAAIKGSGADVVVSSIVGDANRAFFKQMAAAGLTAAKTPVLCLRVSEDDLRHLPPDEVAGHYAAWAYFQSLPDEANGRLIGRFRARYGADRTLSDPAVSAYYAVKLWAQAVDEAETLDTGEVSDSLGRQSMEAGEGVVSIDQDMLHAWRPVRVGRMRRDGQFDVLWSLVRPVRPVSYPAFRSRSAWQAALAKWRATGKPGVDEPAAAAPNPPPPPLPETSRAASPAPAPVVWGPRGVVRPPATARSAAKPRGDVR